ncbi:MAG TPA: hypothetical protein VF916_09560 [Ktedonobacterales bacterium]
MGASGEQAETDEIEALPPEEVRRASAQQQEAAKDQQIRILNPGQISLGEVEARLDRGRRDVDDGGIEQDHELDRREQNQRRPALARRAVRHVHRTTVLSGCVSGIAPDRRLRLPQL